MTRLQPAEIKRLFGRRGTGAAGRFDLLGELGSVYVACSPDGYPSVVIPLPDRPHGGATLRSAGCEVSSFDELDFSTGDKIWRSPAAALVCLESNLLDAFCVLVVDVVRRLPDPRTFAGVLTLIEEWLALLQPRPRLSPEAELGLWGELWFASKARNLDALLAGWRGPEHDNTDFFINGSSVDVKTSRVSGIHHVSHGQLTLPDQVSAWLLSIWVKPDPAAGTHASLAGLADFMIGAAEDQALALRSLALAGYSPADRECYLRRYAVLQEPCWYAVSTVPRVRAFDQGVSNLRYQVNLSDVSPESPTAAEALWRHFHNECYMP
jgi:Putative  PD-(D/E)XK family member, (DUF4420)